jgi:aminoglycoside/choline kinase family phosphotransferase
MIVMKLSDHGLSLSSEELAIFQEPLKELPFVNVQRFLTSIDVHVPEIYADLSSDGLLFLQDLGDQSLWDKVRQTSPQGVLAWYERAIEQLLIIQVEGTAKADPGCVAFQQEFNQRLTMWEFEHFIEYGLERALGRPLSPSLQKILDCHFASIARELDHAPKVLNHRDFHSWNLLVHEEKVWVIDFQDALLAPAQYDLASLLNDRESPAIITSQIERRLIDDYLRGRRELDGRKVDREEFIRLYTLTALQRDLKVIGRFFYLEDAKGKKGYRRFLPRVIRRAQKHLEELEDHHPLLEALRSPFCELLAMLSE